MGSEILKDHPFYKEMNFIPTKHVFGRLIAWLISGALPNEAEHFEEAMLKISEHLDGKAYFTQLKMVGSMKRKPRTFAEQKAFATNPQIMEQRNIPPLPIPRKNLLKVLNLFFDDNTNLVTAAQKLKPLEEDLNQHIVDMNNLSSTRQYPNNILSEADLRKEVIIFYELEKLLLEYQIALFSTIRRI